MTHQEIKERLEALGVSQNKTAKAIDVNKDYLNRVLNGRNELTRTMLIKLKTFIDLLEEKV